jgi:hypothetical protein
MQDYSPVAFKKLIRAKSDSNSKAVWLTSQVGMVN